MVQGVNNELKILIHGKKDFEIGDFNDTSLNSKKNIVLKKEKTSGCFISPVINCREFRELIASWNACTVLQSQVELKIRIKKNNKWSPWFSWGKWSVNNNRRSISNQKNEFGKVDDELLVVLGNEAANGFQYKVILTRENTQINSPEVKLIAASLKLCNENLNLLEFESKEKWLKELNVPQRAQLHIPKIGDSICSPTSVAMVMAYYGYNYDTEYVASHVKDNGLGIYGNWTFNTAFAGSTDLYGYVAKIETVDRIKKMISMDIPAVVSIRTKSIKELQGTIMPYPSGHLIVIRGFKIKDGNEYVIVNDPAEYKKENVRREYKIDEFKKVWRKVAYVISPNLEKIKEFAMV
ncbi:C39 family peptidase [Maledivibacter halophilus]|uniref:Uncharacterized protein YvpB n=1 Tax=Maledivibacter halophilus TaxID=36842 RepID=A0A1T5IHY6_9FIRM|nr:C39 family peptidase [Maledivibacter halophilus]SKC38784.1 Uncharacterized protein YvpB [Maledivibacter halophilus]